MSEFEEYIKVNYPRDYERQKRIYPDQSVEELYSEDYKMWQHQQAIIDNLKAQLNNMETCYIEKKKECEELQGQVGEALEEIQRALNCCESTETACVLGELVKVLRGES